MPPFAPAATVTGPGRTPLPFGAFSVLTLRENSNDVWINGVQWETLTCEPAGVISDFNCDVEEVLGLPRSLDKLAAPYAQASAFSVYGHYQCSAVGRMGMQTYASEQAREHLALREEAAVETAAEALIRSGGALLAGPTTPWQLIAALEQYHAEQTGSQGILWVSRRLATLLGDDGDLSERGGQLRTTLRTPVIAATGVADNFIGITSNPVAYRGQVEDYSNRPYNLMDRGQNNILAIAERDYLIGFEDCGLAYAEATLPAVTVTPPSTNPPAE
ncbi:hypothetical protein HOT31_gp059 [Microbacterium phage Hendrix]|uniref:Uncharacterized protein n=1 Tax=Microbacterium phage Hendrix TaxID=2182341 RepID=A0A2U8UU86_9CAUD|nr:hypothetical protein HOT31_gp059 [Microbacterium phage Hendrix]AWN07730.1 hypothetical protein PBI_HENDRIX_59 [Microbacterium phage Hendrix]